MKLQHRPVFGVTLPRYREKVIFSDRTRHRLCGRWPAREVDKIGLVCAIAKQAFVGRLLFGLWFYCPPAFRFATLASETFSASEDRYEFHRCLTNHETTAIRRNWAL
jgi:hypothetical protein